MNHYIKSSEAINANGKTCLRWHNIELKESKIKNAGLGVFASDTLGKNTMLPYGGKLLGPREVSNRKKSTGRDNRAAYLADSLQHEGSCWSSTPAERTEADLPEDAWIGAMVNHSYKPNCTLWSIPGGGQLYSDSANNEVYVGTNSVIKKGTELTINYGWTTLIFKSRGIEVPAKVQKVSGKRPRSGNIKENNIKRRKQKEAFNVKVTANLPNNK